MTWEYMVGVRPSFQLSYQIDFVLRLIMTQGSPGQGLKFEPPNVIAGGLKRRRVKIMTS